MCGLSTREDGATPDVATRVLLHTATCAGLANRQVKTSLAHRTKWSDRSAALRVGSWNVRSLVENEGSIETARHPGSCVAVEDKKIQLVVRQFECLHISLAGLQ